MTEYMAGGRRRIDRVLAPDYLTGLATIEITELRARRAEADQEETDLSYARRLLQGRLDLLRAEREARESGQGAPAAGTSSDDELVSRLAKVLADRPRESHGLGRHLSRLVPSRIGENRREAERAFADVHGSDLAHLSNPELIGALDHLEDVERRVSRSRRDVQRVVDALTAELARRYQAGQVPVALP